MNWEKIYIYNILLFMKEIIFEAKKECHLFRGFEIWNPKPIM